LDLRPGDILLYDRPGIANAVIKLKRGEVYSHVALVGPSPQVMLEATQGKKCDERPLRTDGLAAIYRPAWSNAHLFKLGYLWFLREARGQRYDWWSLLNFTFSNFMRDVDNKRMFCSEFVTRFFKKCGYPLFSNDADCDHISPGLLPYSPRVFPVWKRADKCKPNEKFEDTF
jgi:hypothetical protein